MYLEQVYHPELAHSSYVIGSAGRCIVVDPARNIRDYLEIAREKNMRITGVLETHLHADFISGHMELARSTGARIYAPHAAGCVFPHVSLKDGAAFDFKGVGFRMIETPGHTPESSVYLVSDLERGRAPVAAFTGDTLFVGDVGRPDLFPGKKKLLARKLFASLQILKQLPGRIEVYPAHGMGSLCGKSISSKLWSTMGNECKYNYALGYSDAGRFVNDILQDMPQAPDHFARCSETNRRGPALVSSLPVPGSLSTAKTCKMVKKGYTVLDTRNSLVFASGHVEGAYNIDREGNLALFAGWIIPPDKPVILVTAEGEVPGEILNSLYSVGVDKIAGYIEGGMYPWLVAGLPFARVNILTAKELAGLLKKGEKIILLDNRLQKERLSGRIKGSISISPADVRHRYKDFSKNALIVTFCASGIRSMTAASILRSKGFKNIFNLLGGMDTWVNLGYPVETGEEGT